MDACYAAGYWRCGDHRSGLAVLLLYGVAAAADRPAHREPARNGRTTPTAGCVGSSSQLTIARYARRRNRQDEGLGGAAGTVLDPGGAAARRQHRRGGARDGEFRTDAPAARQSARKLAGR